MPGLLEARKWDSVRAILITPPLSDCWGKNARPLLRDFAAALGDSGGDELAALEAREDAMSHLRYLDMAVYNNVFSPAGGDAAVSASKDLVRQYVELPAQELAALASRRLLVDRRTRSSRGVVEYRLWIFHAIRVRREVEHERHLAAGRRGTGWIAEVRRGRCLCGNQISDAARHRPDVVPVTASARWRGNSTSSTRRCPRSL